MVEESYLKRERKFSCFLVVIGIYLLAILRYYLYTLGYYFSSYCLDL